jgi:phosphopantothenoylcysteine decarboxylase/phosphopantothenate--cysteine ligase
MKTANSLTNKRILLAVSGGIAAYKSAFLLRELQRLGATVRVVMTEGAKAFITPLTLQALSGFPVHDELFDREAEAAMGHIELARWADILLIAPASANTLARLAAGRADNLLTAVCLATEAPILFAPAMNQQMWQAPATQANLALLIQRGYQQLGPAEGEQACGEFGPGRMLEPEAIVEIVQQRFNTGLLSGQQVLITAGPTQEPFDPVRYLTNRSSGKMGIALAEAALDAGAKVTLVHGPISIPIPERLTAIAVRTAAEMLAAVEKAISQHTIFIAAAAVCDYRPAQYSPEKLKKQQETLRLDLIKNPDILATIAVRPQPPYCVGFAAETTDVIAHAKQKLLTKKIDMIIANDVSREDAGFESDTNAVTLITQQAQHALSLASKAHIARHIIEAIATAYTKEKS